MNAGSMAVQLFRYRSASDYYDDGDILGDTNYWQLGNQIGSYFWLGAFSTAAITQLLAIFGIANGINLLVWMILLGGIGGLVNLVTSIIAMMGYDKAYTVTVDADSSAADITTAAAVMSYIKTEMMWGTLDGLTTELGLAQVSEEWFMWNAWKAEGGEKKEGEGKKGGDKPA